MELLPAEIVRKICLSTDINSYYNLALSGSKIYDLLPNWKVEHEKKFKHCINDINSMQYEILSEKASIRKIKDTNTMIVYHIINTSLNGGINNFNIQTEMIQAGTSPEERTKYTLREIEYGCHFYLGLHSTQYPNYYVVSKRDRCGYPVRYEIAGIDNYE